MKKILVSIQNPLLTEAIILALKKQGQFYPECISKGSPEKALSACCAANADIVMMEVSYLPEFSFKKRMEICNIIKEKLPNCKTVLLCDETADPVAAEKIKQAKQFGKIDAFFYFSVTQSYLTAALDAL